jgi:hypothetical protein
VRIDDGRSYPFRLYRNPRALPRWFVPARIDVVRPEEMERWIAGLDDGRRVAVDVANGAAGGAAELAAPPPREAAVAALSARPGLIVLRITTPRPTLVATSLGAPEGWRVRAGEGAPLPAVVVDGAFLGFGVPAGTTRVELRYVPPGLISGSLLAAAALLACLALITIGRRDQLPAPPARAGA